MSKLQFLMTELWATWSLTETLARIVAIRDEAPGMRTFVLAPNRWPGHKAGQFVPIDVEVNGVRTRRCYSISSGAAGKNARTIEITVKRIAGGKVSAHLHDRARVGDVLRLGTPDGEFTLPEVTPAKLAFVAGGSGITPVAAICRALSLDHDVVIVYASADRHAFVRELGPRAIFHAGVLTREQLDRYVPDLADRAVYTCGPSGLMDIVASLAPHAIRERFSLAPPPVAGDALVTIRDRKVTASGPGPLLEQLERAGERPAYGCRMGICGTCKCTKRAGVTEDLITGAIDHEPGEIRLCTTIARSDLELELPQ